MNNSDLGVRLGVVRAWSGKTAEQISKKTGIPAATIYSWERGIIPGVGNFAKLARYYGMTMDELYGGAKDA